MSHLNTEVSKKIRSAIKAKLVELGAYVDEELPDYIMVMVLNKKSRETLSQDLKLFLNKNTEIFVDWLLGVLEKLEEVVSGERRRKERKERKRVSAEEQPKKKKNKARLKSKVVAPLPPDDSEGEYDPEKILKKSLLASAIKVPERKRGAIEANKSLVLKAVAEADQSIKKRKAQDRLKDPPSTPPDTSDLRERLTKKRQERKAEHRQIRRRSSSSSNPEEKEDEEDLEKMREKVLESLKKKKRRKIVVEDVRGRTETSLSSSRSSSGSSRSPSTETRTKTKFIVTLEGINSQYFKETNCQPIVSRGPLEGQRDEKKKPEAKVAPMQPIKSPEKPKRKRITAPESSSQPTSVNAPQRVQQPSSVLPLCKYWPNCTRGASCFYRHPEKLNAAFGSTALKSKYSWSAASLPPQ